MNNITGENLADKELVNRILNGDQQAFGSVIKATERLVGQIVFKMISHPEDRKDIAQEIYIKAYHNLPGFRFQSKLSTWIGQISYNTCFDYLRKKKLLLTDSLQEDNDPEDDESRFFHRQLLPDPGSKADHAIIQKNITGILNKEIEKLPPVYKTLVTLYHNEELSYEEIGEITGLPEGTVKSYLFRARKALKNSLLFQYKKEDL